MSSLYSMTLPRKLWVWENSGQQDFDMPHLLTYLKLYRKRSDYDVATSMDYGVASSPS